jgi:hypothetical protein
MQARWSKSRRARARPLVNAAPRTNAVMPRQPIAAEIVIEGEERYVVLTYPNGDVVRCRVEPALKPKRRPRRPPTRIKMRRERER